MNIAKKVLFPKNSNSESGQTIIIGAFALFVILVFAMGLIRYMQMTALAQFTQETVKFAAEVAARPSGSRMATGQLEIDEMEANAVIYAELSRALDQATNTNADKQQILDTVVIEIIQPAPGSCVSFPDDTRCFSSPAVRVSVTIPFSFFGVNIDLKRSGIATTSPMPGDGGQAPPLPANTPIVLPTEVLPAPPPESQQQMNMTPTPEGIIIPPPSDS